MSLATQLREIQDALVASTKPSRETTTTRSFEIMLHPTDPLVWLNYAVPVSEPDESDIREMIAVFETADRVPRLEFFRDLWPALPSMLEAQGIELEKAMPVMLLPKADYLPRPLHHDVRDAAAAEAMLCRRIADVAFGMPPGPDDPEVGRGFESGRTFAAYAVHNGEPASVGYAIGTDAIREIAGIGTLPEHRRKGLARDVIARLLERFFGDGGELAWLTPGDDGAESLYSSLGFRGVATQVCCRKAQGT